MHNNRKFLRDRVHEVPGRLYTIPYPFQEFRTGRAQRTTPIFTRLRDYGARFNQVMGYERAMYFKKEEAPLDLSYFGLGEDFKKASDPIPKDESVSIIRQNSLSLNYFSTLIGCSLLSIRSVLRKRKHFSSRLGSKKSQKNFTQLVQRYIHRGRWSAI